MGQKVNPNSIRVGVIKDWDTKWYANKKDFGKFLKQDYDIRQYLNKKYNSYGISKVGIERSGDKITLSIHTARTGMLIGVKGAGVEQLRADLKKNLGIAGEIRINIFEIKKPDMDAKLVAEGIAAMLEKRASFRRTMKQAMGRVMRSGAKGVKVMVSGRLDGAEIARSEHYHEGSIPLQTIRADIDYSTARASTTFGIIGVKVWIYKGEILPDAKKVNTKTGGSEE